MFNASEQSCIMMVRDSVMPKTEYTFYIIMYPAQVTYHRLYNNTILAIYYSASPALNLDID